MKYKISVFKNNKKESGTKQPDYRISMLKDEKWVDAGALWVKVGANDTTFLSGEFDTDKQPYVKKADEGNVAPF